MSKTYRYQTRGTCSSAITFTLNDDGTLTNVSFTGGCNGNTQGICHLIEGMSAEEVVKRCAGIRCGFKPTSCPDQLSRALRAALTDGNGLTQLDTDSL